MKNKILLVASREFSVNVKKRSFIVTTIVMPVLMLVVMLLPVMLMIFEDTDRKTVAVVDVTGEYVSAFESNDSYLYVPTEKMTNAMRSDSTDTDAVVYISENLVENPSAVTVFSRNEVPLTLLAEVEEVLSDKVREQKMKQYDIPKLEAVMADLQQDVEVGAVRWTDEGEQQSIPQVLTIVGGIGMFLIYIFVMGYGAMVMQSVSEEKTNRIVELIVSSVKPVQLLLGKIIGIGCVGLLQMAIWAVLLLVVMLVVGMVTGIALIGQPPVDAPSMAAAGGIDPDILSAVTSVSTVPFLKIFIVFVLCFLGGYLFYASFLAAIGAAVNEPQDSQQLMMPVIIVLMLAFYMGYYAMLNPDSTAVAWSSYIPITSPIVLMVRVPLGMPLYEVIIALGVLFLSAFVMLKLSSKIYRTGILMYGKKPSFKEIFKWLRY